ncbi:glycosyltransferase family 2 protein [Apiospora arundinis]
MALSPWLYRPLAVSGWLTVLGVVTVTLPYVLGVGFLPKRWPLTPEMALVALFCFRYLRLLVHGWSYYFVYKPSSPVPDSPTYTAAEHITVIVPTVEPGGPTFHRCLDSICANSPARVFVVTVGAALHQTAEKMLAPVRRAHPSVTVEVHHTPVANKRRQIDSVVDKVAAANAIDGGAFIISGRTCGVRTSILMDENFRRGYVDERIRFPLGLLPDIGPIVADDDNYLLRFCVEEGYGVKFQSGLRTTVVASSSSIPSSSPSNCVVGIAKLGEYPRFLQQCIRWTRTSFRSNPRSLLSARAWRRHPWSMYGVQLATITNFAVLGDGLQIHLYLQTAWWADRQGQWGLVCLVTWILLTKLVKLIPWLWRYPADIVFLPAYLGFAYYHSWIKLHALLTFWNLEWAGRDLEKINDMAFD